MDISAIIATYKRHHMLEETLKSFCKLNTEGITWELIIVDNANDTATKSVASKYKSVLPVKFLVETTPGKNNALNRAIPLAKGKIFVFTDDDVEPDVEWLQEIIKATNRWPKIRVFGGQVQPVFPLGVSSRITNASFSSYVFAKYHPYRTEQVCVNTYPVGPNCWFRREIFDSGFRYDTNIGPKGKGRISGSELEFFVRLSKAGEKIVYVPSALVFHRIQEYQTRLSYLVKRAYAGGRGWVRIYHPWQDSILLFGVPRFLFRSMLVEVYNFFIFSIQGKNFMEPLMKFAEYLGCLKEFREIRTTKPFGNFS